MGTRHDVLNRHLSRRLSEIRQQHGVTQAALGEKLKRGQNYISNYERSERRLDFFEVIEICDALRISPKEVFCEMYEHWKRR